MATSRMSTRTWTPARPVELQAVFINTATGVCQVAGSNMFPGGDMISFNAWGYVDLKKLPIPDIANANAVRLVGIMLITDGSTSRIPDLAVAFKSPDDDLTEPGSYIGQTIGIGPSGGSRSNMSATVNLVNGVFGFAMLCGDGGKGQFPTNSGSLGYPQDAAYGVNIHVAEVLLP